MSLASRAGITVIEKQELDVGFLRAPVDVHGYADYTLQQVQEVAGGAGTGTVYGSVLPFGDVRLADLDPATNPYWEEDALLVWAAAGTEGARSTGPGRQVAPSSNGWATILVEIEATVLLPDIAVYFFGKER
jgi:hypothetical protein